MTAKKDESIQPIPDKPPFNVIPTIEYREPGYQAGMVLGYLKRSGKLQLDIKLGAIAIGLGIPVPEVSASLDELKECGLLSVITTAATVRLEEPK